jgi:hypothetical protein
MKRFPTTLAAGLNKGRKHRLALLVCVAVLVSAADLALVAAHRSREMAHRAQLVDALRPFHLNAANAASASAADHLFPAEATDSPQVVGWRPWLPGWLSYTLPHGAEEGDPTAYLRN